VKWIFPGGIAFPEGKGQRVTLSSKHLRQGEFPQPLIYILLLSRLLGFACQGLLALQMASTK